MDSYEYHFRQIGGLFPRHEMLILLGGKRSPIVQERPAKHIHCFSSPSFLFCYPLVPSLSLSLSLSHLTDRKKTSRPDAPHRPSLRLHECYRPTVLGQTQLCLESILNLAGLVTNKSHLHISNFPQSPHRMSVLHHNIRTPSSSRRIRSEEKKHQNIQSRTRHEYRQLSDSLLEPKFPPDNPFSSTMGSNMRPPPLFFFRVMRQTQIKWINAARRLVETDGQIYYPHVVSSSGLHIKHIYISLHLVVYLNCG